MCSSHYINFANSVQLEEKTKLELDEFHVVSLSINYPNQVLTLGACMQLWVPAFMSLPRKLWEFPSENSIFQVQPFPLTICPLFLTMLLHLTVL